ncbi:MAG: UbiX family flavin prenyltransferase [Bacteroidales bacterium]|nr:UbiX family flavin prenyltransferase [Bacteroidales bacterium]
MNKESKIILAITGASGSIYAQRIIHFLEKHSNQYDKFDIVFSKNAQDVWLHELGSNPKELIKQKIYEPKDFYAPFASGSANYDTMIICPASMGSIGRIANGISDDLISRAADVMLKERKKLIVVARETPYNLIHLRNLTQLTEAGAIILPATPSFYSKPKNIIELVDTVVYRILASIGLEFDSYEWGESEEN